MTDSSLTDHAVFQDDLKAYADGELPWLRRRAVRRHLTHCASCREEIALMTQLTEDLRGSEPTDALDPALRARIVGIAPPAPNNGGVGAGEEGRSSPTPPLLGAGGRKRSTLPWTLAGVALLAWLVCFPLFQTVRENSRRADVRLSAAPAALPAPSAALPQIRDTNGGPQSADGSLNSAIRNGGGPLAAAGGGVSVTNGLSPIIPQRQVHKEASIGVQVANPEAAGETVANMVKESGGFVAGNTLTTGGDGLKSAEITAKVPVTQFETFLGQVAKLGSVQSKNVSGEDITEKTSDADQTEAVLEGDVQQAEARLKALGTRAKWRDEQAARDVRIQLAEARARLVLLKRLAALSTVTIDLSQTPHPPPAAPLTGGFASGLKASTHDALQSLVGSAGALAALLIWLLAYAPLWVPLLLGGRYALREYRKRQVRRV